MDAPNIVLDLEIPVNNSETGCVLNVSIQRNQRSVEGEAGLIVFNKEQVFTKDWPTLSQSERRDTEVFRLIYKVLQPFLVSFRSAVERAGGVNKNLVFSNHSSERGEFITGVSKLKFFPGFEVQMSLFSVIVDRILPP